MEYNNADDVLYVTNSIQTLYYLIDDVKTSAPSSWNVYNEQRMKAYYRINPRKKPDMIYISKICDYDFIRFMLNEYYIAEENENEVVYLKK